jgi:hypothetical protein
MDVQIVVTVKAHKVMLVALVVAEKQVLAVHGAVVLPPSLRFLYGFAFRVIVILKRDFVFPQIIQDCFFSCHNKKGRAP